jgi:MATE family multidrug resistance protein
MKRTLKLALPVAFTYLGIMLMPTVDLIVVGRLGAPAVGGLGLGGAMFAWVMVTGLGFLYGMDFPASHAIGEGRPENAYRAFVQALYLSLLIALPGTGIVLFLSAHLGAFGFNAEVLPFAQSFLDITASSLIFVFFFNACRGYLQAASIAIPTLVVLIVANILNYFLNIALIEGRFGFPALGFSGSPWATFISRAFMALTLFGIVYFRDQRSHQFIRKMGFKFDRPIFAQIARLGFPSATQMLFEVGVFALVRWGWCVNEMPAWRRVG